MPVVNFEFKARTNELNNLENKLLLLKPQFIGEDHQTDTYFNVNIGRLKLREGNIENSLIYYERENTSGAKLSNVLLYQHLPGTTLKEILIKLHGIKTIVRKIRRIYFIGNTKFHFDRVAGLGPFIEVEAIDDTGKTDLAQLEEQCKWYADFFEIKEGDYIKFSYSDLILENRILA
jgi:predicted adenylyl cyclase CyaB